MSAHGICIFLIKNTLPIPLNRFVWTCLLSNLKVNNKKPNENWWWLQYPIENVTFYSVDYRTAWWLCMGYVNKFVDHHAVLYQQKFICSLVWIGWGPVPHLEWDEWTRLYFYKVVDTMLWCKTIQNFLLLSSSIFIKSFSPRWFHSQRPKEK